MNRPVDRVEFVRTLSEYIKDHNAEIGIKHGLSKSQVAAIMEDQDRANKDLCAQIYDFLRLEGYIDG
tara:strand:- start:405 stop:605 length:201 start_codon:yes stop_codon:yes gene_type:complete